MNEYLKPTNPFFELINIVAKDLEICRHLNSTYGDFKIALKLTK